MYRIQLYVGQKTILIAISTQALAFIWYHKILKMIVANHNFRMLYYTFFRLGMTNSSGNKEYVFFFYYRLHGPHINHISSQKAFCTITYTVCCNVLYVLLY